MKTDNVEIFGVKIHPVEVEELHWKIDNFINNGSHALILNVNINCLNLAFENEWLRSFLNSAELVFCDGAGVVLGARLLGKSIPERITYADWMWQLAEFASNHNFSFFFLGGRPGIPAKAAKRLGEKFPGIKILGTHHGYFDKMDGSLENEKVIKTINQMSPNILIIGFGMPIQERWLMENWEKLDANIVLTGGAVFDYISGDLHRAPAWMTDNGLEWLGRVLIEPRRLWRRYLIGIPLFYWRIFLQGVGVLKI